MIFDSDKFRRNVANHIYPTRRNTGPGFGSALFAATIGAVAAFFLSPKNGKENQEMVKEKARNYLDSAKKIEGQAEEKFQTVKEDFTAKVEDIRNGVSEKTRTTADTIKDKFNQVKEKVASRFEDAAENLKNKEVRLESDASDRLGRDVK